MNVIINNTDSENTPVWVALVSKATPAAQDSGECRYTVVVSKENEKTLLSTLDADDSVVSYELVAE